MLIAIVVALAVPSAESAPAPSPARPEIRISTGDSRLIPPVVATIAPGRPQCAARIVAADPLVDPQIAVRAPRMWTAGW